MAPLYLPTYLEPHDASTKTKPQFPKFQELPAELRVAIWEFAQPSGPRVIRPQFTQDALPPPMMATLDFAISPIPLPPLLLACREASAVVRRSLPWSPLSPALVDFRRDVVFFPLRDYEQFKFHERYPVRPTVLPGPLSAFRTREMAVEYDWEAETRLGTGFLIFRTQCTSLERLFLVIRCKCPTRRVMRRVWPAARSIHGLYAELAMQPSSPVQHPPPEIVILLQRRKHDYLAGDTLSGQRDFFSRFTAVLYKHRHNH